MSKFVFATDAHCGYDRIYRGGEYVWQEAHNLKAIESFIEFVCDYDPELVVFGGDMVNCASISHHTRKNHRFREGMRLADELDLCWNNLIVPIENNTKAGTRKVWIRGNHEHWVDDHVEEFPELEGLVNIERYLELRSLGWEVVDYGEVFTFGKLHWMHGDKIRGKYHAANAMARYHANMRYGHFHTVQMATAFNPMNANDYHTAIAVPCLANRNPGYGQNEPNSWVNGFEFGDIHDKSGLFSDQVVVMVDGQFTVNGRLYG